LASSACEPNVLLKRRGPVAFVWLNRPEVHNAFDDALLAALTEAFHNLALDSTVRVIVLAAHGRSFCAGAQAQWMREQGVATSEQNLEDARRLAALFETIAQCPKPTVARVQGAAIGGGFGLVAACDIGIGSTDAVFATSEVRLGLIPATIAPYVIRAIGERHARRLFLTGERIDAVGAEHIRLLHEAVPPDQLDARIDAVLEHLLAGAPGAQRSAKQLIDAVSGRALTPDLIEDTARRIAHRRADPEASEGLSAFLEKRRPTWTAKP
jgi:methylglutaconyl-CoA hydratase